MPLPQRPSLTVEVVRHPGARAVLVAQPPRRPRDSTRWRDKNGFTSSTVGSLVGLCSYLALIFNSLDFSRPYIESRRKAPSRPDQTSARHQKERESIRLSVENERPPRRYHRAHSAVPREVRLCGLNLLENQLTPWARGSKDLGP